MHFVRFIFIAFVVNLDFLLKEFEIAKAKLIVGSCGGVYFSILCSKGSVAKLAAEICGVPFLKSSSKGFVGAIKSTMEVMGSVIELTLVSIEIFSGSELVFIIVIPVVHVPSSECSDLLLLIEFWVMLSFLILSLTIDLTVVRFTEASKLSITLILIILSRKSFQ